MAFTDLHEIEAEFEGYASCYGRDDLTGMDTVRLDVAAFEQRKQAWAFEHDLDAIIPRTVYQMRDDARAARASRERPSTVLAEAGPEELRVLLARIRAGKINCRSGARMFLQRAA